MRSLTRLALEPFRFFFPLGTGCAVLGLAMWVAFWLAPTTPYPGPGHALIMMHGFVASFIIGFLLTMLPRALGVASASIWHVLIAASGIIAGSAAAYVGALQVAWICHLATLAVPAGFAVLRVGKRASPLPTSFICAAAAGVAAISGSILVVSAHVGAPSWLGALGRALDLQAFPLLMILGIGSFLLPKLGGPSAAAIQSHGAGVYVAMGLTVLASFVLEHVPCTHDPIVRQRIAYALRAAVFAWFVVRQVLPARLHIDAPMHLRSIPFATASIPVGLALPVIWPQFALAWLHLVYIGGITWLTLVVASRVLVGHAPLRGSPSIALIVVYSGLIVVGTLVRVAAGVWPGQAYVLHLAVAALVTIAGIAVWSAILVTRCWSFPPSHR